MNVRPGHYGIIHATVIKIKNKNTKIKNKKLQLTLQNGARCCINHVTSSAVSRYSAVKLRIQQIHTNFGLHIEICE